MLPTGFEVRKYQSQTTEPRRAVCLLLGPLCCHVCADYVCKILTRCSCWSSPIGLRLFLKLPSIGAQLFTLQLKLVKLSRRRLNVMMRQLKRTSDRHKQYLGLFSHYLKSTTVRPCVSMQLLFVQTLWLTITGLQRFSTGQLCVFVNCTTNTIRCLLRCKLLAMLVKVKVKIRRTSRDDGRTDVECGYDVEQVKEDIRAAARPTYLVLRATSLDGQTFNREAPHQRPAGTAWWEPYNVVGRSVVLSVCCSPNTCLPRNYATLHRAMAGRVASLSFGCCGCCGCCYSCSGGANVCPTYDERGVNRPQMEKCSFIIFAVGIFSRRRRRARQAWWEQCITDKQAEGGAVRCGIFADLIEGGVRAAALSVLLHCPHSQIPDRAHMPHTANLLLSHAILLSPLGRDWIGVSPTGLFRHAATFALYLLTDYTRVDKRTDYLTKSRWNSL